MKSKSLEELAYLFYNTKNNNEAISIANHYLEFGKRAKDTMVMSDGYIMLATKHKPDLSINFIDTVIKMNKGNPNKIYPANAYLLKGYLYYNNKELKKASHNFILANKYALQYTNDAFIYRTNHVIGLIKDRIGYFEEALRIHKTNLDFIKKKSPTKPLQFSYVPTYHAISFSYKNLKKYDSAIFYNNKAFDRVKSENDSTYFNHLLLNDGVLNFHLNNIDKSKEAIELALMNFKTNRDLSNTAESYFYLAQISLKKRDTAGAISHLKKIDSIFIKTNDLLPELRSGYETLINYYKDKNNTSKQLLYLERLISLDSVLSNNQKDVSKQIKKEYDIPKLLLRKEKLINQLKKEKSNLEVYILFSIALMSSVLIFYSKKRKKDKIKFEKIISKLEKEKVKDKNVNKKNLIVASKKQDLPTTIFKDIIDKLENFENKERFLNKKITLNNLSKDFGTNTTYLSKVINEKHNKNFTNYISELRINYCLKKLSNDITFRKYTIKAIAFECGFNNAETFSKKFKQITGLYPSYYLKKIDEKTT